jgi:hypothetical protein
MRLVFFEGGLQKAEQVLDQRYQRAGEAVSAGLAAAAISGTGAVALSGIRDRIG